LEIITGSAAIFTTTTERERLKKKALLCWKNLEGESGERERERVFGF
jgi:hypothetical protein